MIVVIACYVLMTLPMVALYILLGLKWTQMPRSYKFVRFALLTSAGLLIAYPGTRFVSSVAPEHAYPAAILGLSVGLIVSLMRAQRFD
jgi:hypothetical protein